MENVWHSVKCSSWVSKFVPHLRCALNLKKTFKFFFIKLGFSIPEHIGYCVTLFALGFGEIFFNEKC